MRDLSKEETLMIKKILKLFHWHERPQIDEYTREYLSYFDQLFNRAARTSGFQFVCALLRVEGIKSGYWDAFVEAEDAANDFSNLLRETNTKRQQKRAMRLGLFLYCHLTEMSAPFEVMANFLRIIQGKQYSMVPFAHLTERPKSLFAKRHLPSPAKKIGHLRELAVTCGEEKLVQAIDEFFNSSVRNAFYHSDYTISEDEFRIAEGGELGKQVLKLGDISTMLTKRFAFYSAFFITYNTARKGLVDGKKFIRWPNYEVLELLSDQEGLTGFKIHFPNGSYSLFERKRYEGTTALNMSLADEGIQLFVGDFEKYNRGDDWYVNGKIFEDYGTRYNEYGFWRPIVFQRNSDVILQKALKLTEDKVVQGLLFYIFATGHAAIEFTIKSDNPLYTKETVGKKFTSGVEGVELFPCPNLDGKKHLYDGTLYLKSKEVAEVIKGLNLISEYVKKKRREGLDLRSRFKYQIYNDGSEGTTKQNEDGSFTFTLSMDDPRVTMVTNNLGMFPRSD